MDHDVFKTLCARRISLPTSFTKKELLLEFHHTTLSLLTPYFSHESVESLRDAVVAIGTELLGMELWKLFERELPNLQNLIISDAESVLQGDPAAQSLEEVFLCYPGLFAAATYRVAHALFLFQVPLMPRILSEYAHQLTGIDIHPAAAIGREFCIDHGTGVVIGETAEIGDRVKIYQGVTLGALSVKKSFASTKRHPTIEDDVVIYANATLLGPITIGRGSVIGGNVWLDASVAAGQKVLRTPSPDRDARRESPSRD